MQWFVLAARTVTNSPYEARLQPLINELYWYTTKQWIDTETAKIIYKALHNDVPEYKPELFHRSSDAQSRVLHNSKTDLHVLLPKTSSGQESFSYRGAYIWHALSHERKLIQFLL